MKIVPNLLALALCVAICGCSDSDPIPEDKTFEGDVSLYSQEEVDQFGKAHYTTIIGNLFIDGQSDDITSLKPLDHITTIEGGLYLANTTAIEDLSDLSSLVSLNFVTIVYNSGIKNLKGLEKIENLDNLGIQNNENLESLEGIENLSTVGRLSISRNPNLQLVHFPNLISADEIDINNNETLTDVSLDMITDLEGTLIVANAPIANLSFDRLGTTGGIYLGHLPKLTDLSAFAALRESTQITLEDIPLLTGLRDLINLQIIKGSLIIYDIGGRNKSALFQSADIPSLETIEGSISINNAPLESLYMSNLKTISADINLEYCYILNSLSFPKLETIGGLNINTDSNLELIEMPALQRVSSESLSGSNLGTINLYGFDLTELHFESLTTIEKNLLIHSSKIEILQGFDQLESIGDRLSIYINEKMTGIETFENLTEVKNIDIAGNELLKDYCALIDLAQSGVYETTTVENNFYNPVFDELTLENCSQ